MRQFKFIGDPRDEYRGPRVIRLFGYDFPMDQPVDVAHPGAIAKLAGNDHFEELTPDPVSGRTDMVSNSHPAAVPVPSDRAHPPALPADLTDRQARAMGALRAWFARFGAEDMPLSTFNAIMVEAGVIAPDASRAQSTNLRAQLIKRGMIGQEGGKSGRVWLASGQPLNNPPA